MYRLTRILAARLRRIAATHWPGAARRGGRAPAPGDAWARLELVLTSGALPMERLRHRELVQENARLAVTLAGHDPVRVQTLLDSARARGREAERAAVALLTAILAGPETRYAAHVHVHDA